MRQFMSAASFDFSKRSQNLWRLDLADGAVSKIGEDVVFESADRVRPMPFGPAPTHFVDEVERHHPEGVLRLKRLPLLCDLAFGRWIAPVSQDSARIITPQPRLFQRHLGICAKGEQLFLSGESVFEPPQLRARGVDEEEEALLIGKLKRLRGRLCVSYRKFSERHGGTLKLIKIAYPVIYPRDIPASSAIPWNLTEH